MFWIVIKNFFLNYWTFRTIRKKIEKPSNVSICFSKITEWTGVQIKKNFSRIGVTEIESSPVSICPSVHQQLYWIIVMHFVSFKNDGILYFRKSCIVVLWQNEPLRKLSYGLSNFGYKRDSRTPLIIFDGKLKRLLIFVRKSDSLLTLFNKETNSGLNSRNWWFNIAVGVLTQSFSTYFKHPVNINSLVTCSQSADWFTLTTGTGCQPIDFNLSGFLISLFKFRIRVWISCGFNLQRS